MIARFGALFSKKDASIGSVDRNEATREVITLLLSELQRYEVVVQMCRRSLPRTYRLSEATECSFNKSS